MTKIERLKIMSVFYESFALADNQFGDEQFREFLMGMRDKVSAIIADAEKKRVEMECTVGYEEPNRYFLLDALGHKIMKVDNLDWQLALIPFIGEKVKLIMEVQDD